MKFKTARLMLASAVLLCVAIAFAGAAGAGRNAGVDPKVAAEVPSKYKGKTLTVAHRRDLRAERVHSPRTARRSSAWTPIWPRRSARVMGVKVKIVERDLRQHHPGAPVRQVRPRHVLVHRHEGAREGRRLRDLLLGRHVVLRQGDGRPDDQLARRPLRAHGRRREGHDAGRRRDRAERQVQEGRQVRRDRSAFPDQNGANLALSSGRAEVAMADSPVAAYQVKQSNGTVQAQRQVLRTRRTASRSRRAAAWPSRSSTR